MAKKHSLIGFEKSKLKSIKFENKAQANVGKFIKFYYGPRGEKPLIGKIQKVCDKGLEVYTDYGWCFPMWDRVDRVFETKITGRIKETKITSVNGLSKLPIIDGVINRIIDILKQTDPFVKIKDIRSNKAKAFSRKVTIGNVKLIIPDNTVDYATVIGCSIKKIKLNKNNKFPTSKIKKLINDIENQDSLISSL
jgi:hypothetical protein